MPVTLNASTSSGFAATADNSGVLTLQSNGTDAASVSGSNFQFNSGYGSVATAYGCRAWVNFNGTGTVAIRASGNVTSITDNGTGNYTVNFTTAMPDANYCAQVRAALTNFNISQPGNTAQTVSTTSYNPGTFYINGSNSTYSFSAGDPTDVYVAIFR